VDRGFGTPHGFALLLSASTVGIGLVETAEDAAAASLAPDGIRGPAFGLLAATHACCKPAASAIAGALRTLVSLHVAFLYLAASMIRRLCAR
jgi:hypothetical protein